MAIVVFWSGICSRLYQSRQRLRARCSLNGSVFACRSTTLTAFSQLRLTLFHCKMNKMSTLSLARHQDDQAELTVAKMYCFPKSVHLKCPNRA